jgi:hypothetical protein
MYVTYIGTKDERYIKDIIHDHWVQIDSRADTAIAGSFSVVRQHKPEADYSFHAMPIRRKYRLLVYSEPIRGEVPLT